MSMRRWLAGAGVLVLTSPMVACAEGTSPDDTGASAPTPAATTSADPAPTGSATPPTGSPSPTGTAPPSPRPTATSGTDPVLSGTRQVTIVRVDAFESGLTLTDEGRLGEADGDSGRQLFVPTPLTGGTFLIRSYRGAGGGPGTGEPVCWQVHNPQDTGPLTVRGATCDEGDAGQQFTIAPAAGGERTYQISNRSAYLRYSAQSGLILEELGDAEPSSGFRFNDNGPAPDRE
ncbi:RICIN domain-containing protein [Micromonospora rosaria]|uniref:RICIN domain-containing protein n=1 Tax=Micromonospora rosaria TaxID=47874 RepID=UPI000AD82B1C|nr:hypothetical protein [Micromonospora rosaria]